MTIDVAPVPDKPVAVVDTYAVKKNTPLSVPAPGVLGNDTDVDGLGVTVKVTSSVTKGALTMSPDGSFTYVPANNYTGNVTFKYRAVGPTGLTSNEVTVTLAVK